MIGSIPWYFINCGKNSMALGSENVITKDEGLNLKKKIKRAGSDARPCALFCQYEINVRWFEF